MTKQCAICLLLLSCAQMGLAQNAAPSERARYIKCAVFDYVLLWDSPTGTRIVQKLGCGEEVTVLAEGSLGYVKVKAGEAEGYVINTSISQTRVAFTPEAVRTPIRIQAPAPLQSAAPEPQPKPPSRWRRALQGAAEGAAATPSRPAPQQPVTCWGTTANQGTLEIVQCQ